MIALYAIAFLTGLIVGSFLNVCIYRVPRGLSILFPPSQCPSCGAPIRPYDNIPVLSFLFLKGKCRHCASRISLRYPLVELLNALMYTAVLWRFGPDWHTLVFCVFCSAMIVITFIDLDFQIIPDRITLPGIPLGIITASLILPDPFHRTAQLGFTESALGLLFGGALFYTIAVVSRGGMGGGDIKMMAMVGAFLGWKSILLTTFSGSLFGSLIGIFLMIFRGKGRKTKIPFGPFLSGGAILSLFYGQEILSLYLSR